MRSPTVPKSLPPAAILALPETSTRQTSRSPVFAATLSPGASLWTSKPTWRHPALCGVMWMTWPRSARGFTCSLDMSGLLPYRNEALEPGREVGDGFCVRHLARQPAVRGVGEDRPAHGEAFDHFRTRGDAKSGREPALRRFQTQHHDAATIGVIHFYCLFYRAPRCHVGLRLELPPVGLDAERVQAGEDRGHRAVGEPPVLAGDDFDQQLAA